MMLKAIDLCDDVTHRVQLHLHLAEVLVCQTHYH